MGWMLRNQILHHGGKEADHVGEKSTASPCGAKKWNNKLDSSNKTNKSETWWPNQFNNLCNTSGAAHPISFLPILLSFVFKEYTAEHSSSSCPSYSFSCTHLFLDYRWIFLRGRCLLVFGMLFFHSSEWRVWLDKGNKWLWVEKRSHPSKMLLVSCLSAEILTGLSSFLHTILFPSPSLLPQIIPNREKNSNLEQIVFFFKMHR